MPADSSIKWRKYDASKPDAEFDQLVDDMATRYILSCGIPRNIDIAVERATAGHLEQYARGERPDLDKIEAIHVFRPSEFDHVDANDAALAELIDCIRQTTFKWSEGSNNLAQSIQSKFKVGRSKRVESHRAPLLLDTLVEIAGRWAAIEVEASNNKDNGITSMRFAIRKKQADFGVLIVPWTAIGAGRASEGDALGRIDDEFDGQVNSLDGPIYRLAIVQRLDLCRRLLKESRQVRLT